MLNIVSDIDNRVAVKHVLMSVSDKTGLDAFVPALVKACPGVKIYSTGGTYTKVKEILGAAADGTLVAVSDYTGQPEMQGGLVKTLDFKIYLGLLSETYNPAHQADLCEAHSCTTAQLVAAWTAAQRGVTAVLCGARRVKNAVENAAAAAVSLSPDELARMRADIEKVRG